MAGDGDQAVAHRVVGDRLAKRQPLGHRSTHIIGRQVLHQAVFHSHGEDGEIADGVGDKRQQGVGKDSADLIPAALHVFKVVPRKTAHRQPLQMEGEDGDEEDPHHVGGQGIGHVDKHGAQRVEAAVVPERLRHPERNGDRIAQQKGCQPEEGGDREPLLDEIPHRLVVAGRFAQIEYRQLLQPLPVGDQHGLVEAIEGLELLDLFIGEGLCPLAATGAAGFILGNLGLQQHAFDRSTRHETGDGEDEQGDTEKRRNDQKHPA